MTLAETARAFFDAYTNHDVTKMLSFFSPEATYEYVPYGEEGKGRVHDSAAAIWGGFIDAFPDFQVESKNLMTTEDGIVIVETVQGGTQVKDIIGIKSKGRAQFTPHIFIFRFNQAGLICAIKAYWDNNTIYVQLGHTELHD